MQIMNSTVLAFIGDSVFELYIRRHVIDKGQVNADLLHQSAVRFVRAEAQARAMKAMLDELTDDEMSLVKRARNKKISTKPKHVDPIIYKWATAFEALIGHLYLSEKYDRMEEIINKSIQIIESKDNSVAPGNVLRKRINDKNGEVNMSKADEIFIQNCKDILENGVWDTGQKVRPRWKMVHPHIQLKVWNY